MFIVTDLFFDFFVYLQKAKQSPESMNTFINELKNLDTLFELKMKPYLIDKASYYKKELHCFQEWSLCAEKVFIVITRKK